MFPYDGRFGLTGTPVFPAASAESPQADDEEVEYLCRAANRYLARPIHPREVLRRYSGVRPLYDDGSSDPSAITRDYTLRLDDDQGTAPVLSVFGGKITTYRRLAEHALDKLRPSFPDMRAAWTSQSRFPGSDFDSRDGALDALAGRYAKLPQAVVHGVFER